MTRPFDATSTTDEVLESRNLKGMRVLVTGASAGLGVETARALAGRGASVVWAATSRDLDAQGGLYIQDCGIAPPGTAEVTDVKAYALDAAAAERLWKISETMVGQTFTVG